MNSKIVYADVIGHISVENGMVRMDLYSDVPLPSQLGRETQHTMSITHRLVMPAMGFIQSFPVMEKLMAELEKEGAIIREPEE